MGARGRGAITRAAGGGESYGPVMDARRTQVTNALEASSRTLYRLAINGGTIDELNTAIARIEPVIREYGRLSPLLPQGEKVRLRTRIYEASDALWQRSLRTAGETGRGLSSQSATIQRALQSSNWNMG